MQRNPSTGQFNQQSRPNVRPSGPFLRPQIQPRTPAIYPQKSFPPPEGIKQSIVETLSRSLDTPDGAITKPSEPPKMEENQAIKSRGFDDNETSDTKVEARKFSMSSAESLSENTNVTNDGSDILARPESRSHTDKMIEDKNFNSSNEKELKDKEKTVDNNDVDITKLGENFENEIVNGHINIDDKNSDKKPEPAQITPEVIYTIPDYTESKPAVLSPKLEPLHSKPQFLDQEFENLDTKQDESHLRNADKIDNDNLNNQEISENVTTAKNCFETDKINVESQNNILDTQISKELKPPSKSVNENLNLQKPNTLDVNKKVGIKNGMSKSPTKSG